MKKYLSIFLAFCTLIACKKDETLRYNNITMGNIHGEQIVSDQGNTFNIAEKLFDVDLASFKSGRVMVMCDVLKETSEKTYDVRLTGISEVLTKKVKTMEDSTPEEDLATDDPLIIREIWASGGYLNMAIEIAYKIGSGSYHYINLLREEDQQTEDGYTFILRHNASGEVPSTDDREYFVSTGYVSFPIAGIIAEDSAKVTLKWNSFKFENGMHDFFESESLVKGFNWSRDEFEHTPAGVQLKSAAVLK